MLKNEDIIAPPPYSNEPYYRMERPKIMKCPSTGKYVMWFQWVPWLQVWEDMGERGQHYRHRSGGVPLSQRSVCPVVPGPHSSN